MIKNVQKGIKKVWKCHKVARYVIWPGSSHLMVCCHFSETLPTISYEYEIMDWWKKNLRKSNAQKPGGGGVQQVLVFLGFKESTLDP